MISAPKTTVRSLSLALVLAYFTTFCLPLEALAQKRNRFKSSKDKNIAIAEYAGSRIQWKVVFSPGGGNVDRELDVDVEGQDAQLFMNIISLKDLAADPKGVGLEASDPKGNTIGKKRNWSGKVKRRGEGDGAQGLERGASEAQVLGLKELPRNAKFDQVDTALKEYREVQTRGEKKKFDLSSLGSEEELKQAEKDYRRQLKAAKNAGFVRMREDREGSSGFASLNVVNPTNSGRWKMKVNGANGDPFVAVALTIPIELTDADVAEVQAAGADIVAAIQDAFPDFQEWGPAPSNPCKPCNSCKNVVYATGLVAAIVGLIAGAVSLGSGTVAVVAGYLSLVAAAVGAWSILSAGAYAVVMVAMFAEDPTCAFENWLPRFCTELGKKCIYSGCSYSNCGV